MFAVGLPLLLVGIAHIGPGVAGKVDQLGVGLTGGMIFAAGEEVGLEEVVEGAWRAAGVGVVARVVVVGVGVGVVGGGGEGGGGGVGGEVDGWIAVCGGDHGEGRFVVGLEDLLEGGVGVELRGMGGE